MSNKPTEQSAEQVKALQKNSELLQAVLIKELAHARKIQGLTQAQLAERMGRTRMTIQRAESDLSGVGLATFVELALALGYAPELRAPSQAGTSALLRHRGVHHSRTTRELEFKDRQREASFASGWESINAYSGVGLAPILETLLPGATQEQATAAASAIQWLGTDVGFGFLCNVLAAAGYHVTAVEPARHTELM